MMRPWLHAPALSCQVLSLLVFFFSPAVLALPTDRCCLAFIFCAFGYGLSSGRLVEGSGLPLIPRFFYFRRTVALGVFASAFDPWTCCGQPPVLLCGRCGVSALSRPGLLAFLGKNSRVCADDVLNRLIGAQTRQGFFDRYRSAVSVILVWLLFTSRRQCS